MMGDKKVHQLSLDKIILLCKKCELTIDSVYVLFSTAYMLRCSTKKHFTLFIQLSKHYDVKVEGDLYNSIRNKVKVYNIAKVKFSVETAKNRDALVRMHGQYMTVTKGNDLSTYYLIHSKVTNIEAIEQKARKVLRKRTKTVTFKNPARVILVDKEKHKLPSVNIKQIVDQVTSTPSEKIACVEFFNSTPYIVYDIKQIKTLGSDCETDVVERYNELATEEKTTTDASFTLMMDNIEQVSRSLTEKKSQLDTGVTNCLDVIDKSVTLRSELEDTVRKEGKENKTTRECVRLIQSLEQTLLKANMELAYLREQRFHFVGICELMSEACKQAI